MKQLAAENAISECAHESETLSKTVWGIRWQEMEGRAGLPKKSGRQVPFLVTVNEPWHNRADVRAGTDEQDEQVEERGL